MICVYSANCTDFSNNGLGPVLPQSCTVTETLNGEWELTLTHPIDEDGRWTRLTEGRILRAPVPAAMTPQIGLVTQQYQTTTYDVLIYKVSTQRDPLRLRSGTGTSYKILGKYKKGTEIIVLDKSNSGWYEVTCPDGKHGYMSSEYLTYVRTDTGSTQSNVGFHNQTIQPRQLRDQPFRIYRVVPELDKVTVYARHVFYDLLDNMIKSLKPSPDAVGASVVQSLSSACLSAHGFTFYSDLTGTAEDVEWENKNPVEALLGEGGLTEKYGAELARDWFDVFLVKRVGNDTDVHIRERKNLTLSEPIDALRIIPDSQFEFVQYALKARIPRKYEQQRKAENDAMPKEMKTKAAVYGATMLSGILYCAHCGKKLVGSYCTKQRAKCPGDTGYSASETSYHVGVVVSSSHVDGGIRVTAIEGNTSGSGTINGIGFKTYDPTPGTGQGEGGRYHKNILGFGNANGLG